MPNRYQRAVSDFRDDYVTERENMEERANEDGDFDEREQRRFKELGDTVSVLGFIIEDLAGISSQDDALAKIAARRSQYDTTSRANDGEILACIRAKDAIWQLAS